MHEVSREKCDRGSLKTKERSGYQGGSELMKHSPGLKPLGTVLAMPMSGAGLRPQQAAARVMLIMNMLLELGETS